MGSEKQKMSKTVSIQEAAQQFSELLALVRHGEDVVIAEEDRPVARLVSIPPRQSRPREFGGYEGKIRIAPDFDSPLPPEFWLGGKSP